MINKFNEYKSMQCDICEHLDTLQKYAKKCSHITEFGVRGGVSTSAFITSNPKVMRCYDIVYNIPLISECIKYADINNIDFRFIQESTLETEIENTELLFIDTLHTYNQLLNELEFHHNKVSKYIILHDTVSFGETGEDNKQGLLFAITEFLLYNQNWEIKEHFLNNNGLMILGKIL